MFHTEEVHRVAQKLILDTTVPQVQSKHDVGKSIEVGIAVLRGLGSVSGWFRKRKVRKAIEVLEAVNETVWRP